VTGQRFDEQWISAAQLAMTTDLAAGTNGLRGDAVEIGVHQGRSALPVAAVIWPGRLHAVDDWSGLDLPPDATARDNHAIWLANVAASPAPVNITTWRMEWRDWAGRWAGPVRFAHIDAHHTTKEVADQIAYLWPRMVPGGVLAGDDYGKPPVGQAVRDAFGSSLHVYEDLWWFHA